MVRTVLVLGTHRSGTSLVAGMLHTLGVNMGPPGTDERWIYPNWANPTGQYENPEFSELLHQFLDFDGGEPRWRPAWDDLTERARIYRPRFLDLVRRTESPLWGWKQAWSMLILDALLPDLQNPYFVVVHRNLEEIATSLHRRDGLSRAEAERVTQEIWKRMAMLQEHYPNVPTLKLDFAEISRDPGGTVRRIIQFLGLSPPPEAIQRATALVIPGPALRRAAQRYAVRELVTLPQRYAWLLSKDLREHSRFTAHHLARTAPREFYRTLRASL